MSFVRAGDAVAKEDGICMVFLLASIVVLVAIAFFMPKRLSHLEIWATMLFSSVLECFIDVSLDLHLNLYGYFHTGFEWLSYIPVIGLYPATSTIFLNYYPFDYGKITKTFYIIGWSGFCILFEFASLKSGYFYYHHWRLWYSALCYPVLLCILVWDLKFIRKLNAKA